MKVFQKETDPVFVPVTIVLETEEEYQLLKSHVQSVELSSLLNRSFDKHTKDEASVIFDFGVTLFGKLIRKDD